MDLTSLLHEQVAKLEDIQKILIDFFDDEKMDEVDLQNFIQYINNQQIPENKHLFIDFLTLISVISNNHRRNQFFITKVERILKTYQNTILQNYSNFTIFTIFKVNKRILYFLFNEKMIIPDQSIIRYFTDNEEKLPGFLDYFCNELMPNCNNKCPNDNSFDPELFDEHRKSGENEKFICKLIRNDSIEDFVAYVTKNSININSASISRSIFETNLFLIERNQYSLIEYATFFGSIQIFKYLLLNNVDLTPSLWLFSIHGKSGEIIHLLEENKVQPEDESFEKCIIESIKCHHNEIYKYIKDNLYNPGLIQNEENQTNQDKREKQDLFQINFQFFNFENISKEFNLSSQILNDCCKYNCCYIVDFLLNNTDFDINKKSIQTKNI